MQQEIHPEFTETVIRCACGAEYRARSTGEDLRVEVCSRCHPFYTGRQQRASSGGRIEQFRKKYGYLSEEERRREEEQDEDKSADAE